MTRVATMPVRGKKRRAQPIVWSKSFQLPIYRNSENSIEVKVPSREVMNWMTFFDVPISSIYGPQWMPDKISAMQSKITNM